MSFDQADLKTQTTTTEWWKTGIVYQIYPRSYQDSNGDGIGDLRGIASRLDHLVDLGVEAIWISPVFPSPMDDFGYDISDYCNIEPIFGTLEDFDALREAVHARGLKLLLDFVPSHSSDQHPWFQESRASRDNPKRDWYIWRDAKPDGSPPNNWISEFGGPAWTWDEATGQYYLSIFLSSQPALNWRHPDVRAEMLNVLRFWFERGVDGFRVDAVSHVAPFVDGGDHPANPIWEEHMGPARSQIHIHGMHQEEGFQIVKEMRQVSDAYPDRVLIGEAYGGFEDVMRYYGESLDGFHLPFNFALLHSPWNAEHIRHMVEEYEAALPEGAWPNWVLGNHDRSRIASRAGRAQAKVAATLLLTLRGTPTIYQGDELGLDDAHIPHDAVQDPWEKQVPGIGLGRDPVRTPMPWEPGPTAGFTTGTPWLPLHAPQGADVATQSGAKNSVLNFHRALIRLRRAEPALVTGTYRTVSCQNAVYVYERVLGDDVLTICLNFSGEEKPIDVSGRLILSSRSERGDADGTPATIASHEALILKR